MAFSRSDWWLDLEILKVISNLDDSTTKQKHCHVLGIYVISNGCQIRHRKEWSYAGCGSKHLLAVWLHRSGHGSGLGQVWTQHIEKPGSMFWRSSAQLGKEALCQVGCAQRVPPVPRIGLGGMTWFRHESREQLLLDLIAFLVLGDLLKAEGRSWGFGGVGFVLLLLFF